MANPLTKSDKTELNAMRRMRNDLVQEVARAKACFMDVTEAEEALATLDRILEAMANQYLGTGPVT